MTKFLIITSFGIVECEAEDFEDAAKKAYDPHAGYNNVFAIVKAGEQEE